MGRVAVVALFGWVAGCVSPPGSSMADADAGAGGAAVDGHVGVTDAVVADGAVADASIDAAPLPDAPPPPADAAPPPDADPDNPYGILLEDVTTAALGGYLYGGRSAVDWWGVGSGAAVGDV